MELKNLTVLIRGAGDLASGVAYRLQQCHFRVCMTEVAQPLAVRRGVSFCEAVYEGKKEIEGVVARLVASPDEVSRAWQAGEIPVLVDPEARIKDILKPDVLIDAIIAKKNLGTEISDAPLVIGLGVGFQAGRDVHAVIETNRGHNLGRVILRGEAEPDTGIPGDIAGYGRERVLRASGTGRFTTDKDIGDYVAAGQAVASAAGAPVITALTGIIRGLLRDGVAVQAGMKVGDVDPRGISGHCDTISEKARAIGGGVLEAILSRYNI